MNQRERKHVILLYTAMEIAYGRCGIGTIKHSTLTRVPGKFYEFSYDFTVGCIRGLHPPTGVVVWNLPPPVYIKYKIEY